MMVITKRRRILGFFLFLSHALSRHQIRSSQRLKSGMMSGEVAQEAGCDAVGGLVDVSSGAGPHLHAATKL